MDLIWTRVFPHNAELIYVETFMSLYVPIMWRIFSTVNLSGLRGDDFYFTMFLHDHSPAFFYLLLKNHSEWFDSIFSRQILIRRRQIVWIVSITFHFRFAAAYNPVNWFFHLSVKNRSSDNIPIKKCQPTYYNRPKNIDLRNRTITKFYDQVPISQKKQKVLQVWNISSKVFFF